MILNNFGSTASPFLEDGKKVAGDFQAKGLSVIADFVDQGDHESILKLKDKIKKEYGKLNVLVNCAVARPMKTADLAVNSHCALPSGQNSGKSRNLFIGNDLYHAG